MPRWGGLVFYGLRLVVFHSFYSVDQCAIGNGLFPPSWGFCCWPWPFNLPLLAPSYAWLCGSLFLIGVLSGFTDVSMNALMSIIERRDDTHLMSAAHGFFSLGGFVGAGVGSVFLLYFSSPSVHMLGMTVVVILFNLWFARHYATVDEPAEKKAAAKEKSFGKPSVLSWAFRPLLLWSCSTKGRWSIGVTCFCMRWLPCHKTKRAMALCCSP